MRDWVHKRGQYAREKPQPPQADVATGALFVGCCLCGFCCGHAVHLRAAPAAPSRCHDWCVMCGLLPVCPTVMGRPSAPASSPRHPAACGRQLSGDLPDRQLLQELSIRLPPCLLGLVCASSSTHARCITHGRCRNQCTWLLSVSDPLSCPNTMCAFSTALDSSPSCPSMSQLVRLVAVRAFNPLSCLAGLCIQHCACRQPQRGNKGMGAQYST